MIYNVFLATPKNADRESVEQLEAHVVERFTPALEGIQLHIVRAEDDYRDHFARCGGWEAWCRDVGQGVDYMFRTPRYNCIVCTQRQVGKATADIVRFALEGMRMVVAVREGGGFDRVYRVATLDANDYKAGWWLEIDE